MSSARLVGQFGTLAFGVGVGFLIAMGCDSAVASADTGHTGAGTASSHAASPTRDHTTAVAVVHIAKPAAAQTVSAISAVPAVASTDVATAKATPTAPHLPTPVEVQQAVAGAVQTARRDLVALEHNVEAEITRDVAGLTRALGVKPPPQKIYGNLEKNKVYWGYQTAENCVLMASASVVGQLTGTMPTQQAIADEAMSLQSVVDPSRKMYLGLNTDDRVQMQDAEALLKQVYGVDATTVTYEKTQGSTALKDLEADLTSGKAVMVGVEATPIWNAIDGKPSSGALAERADHEISVIAVNATTGTVYINDSGIPNGAGVAVPLMAFMAGWRADGYDTTTAVLAQAVSTPIAA